MIIDARVCVMCGFSRNVCTWSNVLSSFGKRCLADLSCSWAAEGSQASSLWGDPSGALGQTQ